MRPQPHPLTYILPVFGMAAAWVLLTDQVRFAPFSFSNRLAFWYPFVVAAIVCGFTWSVVQEPQRKVLHSVIAIIFTLIHILMVWPIYQNSLFGHPHSRRPAGESYRPSSYQWPEKKGRQLPVALAKAGNPPTTF